MNSSKRIERWWSEIEPCDDSCYEYEPDGAGFQLQLLRSTLASFDGEDPDQNPNGWSKHTGRWWEDYQVHYDKLPREVGPWRLVVTEANEWKGWLTDDQLMGRMIPPGRYTQLMREGVLWMSDTPAEILGHLEFLWCAHGRVLVNGLGLGAVLPHILGKKCVTSIDVVEVDPDVISLIAPYYDRAIRTGRLTIHEADAFTIRWPEGKRWEVIYSDIWPYISADNFPEMKRLRRRYQNRTILHFMWEEFAVRELWRVE